jgi:hypothetical protein
VVVTDTSLKPVSDANVAIIGTSVHAATGENGRVRIHTIPVGQHHLSVQRIGYRPLLTSVDVLAADTVRLSLSLIAANPTLDRVTVTATGSSLRMSEFEDRRAHANGGQFLTAPDIDKRNSVFATELVRTFRGMSVKQQTNSNGITDYYAVAGRADAVSAGVRRTGPPILGCPVEVYVDNIRMPTPYNLDNLPPPSTIAGIEYYTGPATTPPQFGGLDRRCGVMLVWTRDRSAVPR